MLTAAATVRLSTIGLVLLGLSAPGAAGPSPGASPAPGPAAAHDLHISYGNLAVEDALMVLHTRVFRDDLTAALAGHSGNPIVDLSADRAMDRILVDYISAHVRMEADGTRLEPELMGSGEDELDREPVWWFQLKYEADRPIRDLSIVNTVLFELFDDQRNILKVVHFPAEDQRTYYFAPGEDSIRVSFPMR